MRFTPSGECKLIKAKVLLETSYLVSYEACTVYVYDNKPGMPYDKPGTLRFKYFFNPPLATVWNEVDITPPITYDEDFWITVKPSPHGHMWLFEDETMDYPDRMATKWNSDIYQWTVPGELGGDLFIRAVVNYTGVEEKEVSSEPLILNENYPNPFVDKTTISYALPKETKVELKIYDVTGKAVRTLVNGVQTAGQQRVVWDRKNEGGEVVPTGIYFYKLTPDNANSCIKVMVVL